MGPLTTPGPGAILGACSRATVPDATGHSPARLDGLSEDAVMAGLRYRTLPPFVLLALCWPALVQAPGTKTGGVTTLPGRVTPARAAPLPPLALKVKEDVLPNHRVPTG